MYETQLKWTNKSFSKVAKRQISLKNIRLKALIAADNEEVNFLYENNLPKDLKSKRSVASFAAKPWFTIELFLITGLWSANWISRKYRKLHIRVCLLGFSQIQLQQLFTGKESFVLKSLPAVVALGYFTPSEKENLRTERQQNYVLKNEKREKTLTIITWATEKWSK